MANDMGKVVGGILVVLLIGYLAYNAGIARTGTPTAGSTTPATASGAERTVTAVQCPFAPTIQLAANDKYVSGQTNWGTWKYKINAGGTLTDADGSFEISQGDGVKVLAGDGNSTKYYRTIWDLKWNANNIKGNTELGCGLNNPMPEEMIAYTGYGVLCYNEIGQAINGTQYANANLSIGQGGSRNVKCELTGVAKKGMPYGGVMVWEFNKTTYKEEEVAGTWDGATMALAAKTPNAYGVALSTGTTKSFIVPEIGNPSLPQATHTFITTFTAEADANPGAPGSVPTPTAYGDGMIGNIYPINCYEEEDVTPSEFRCAVEDMDNTFVSPSGTTKQTATVAEWLIPVQ